MGLRLVYNISVCERAVFYFVSLCLRSRLMELMEPVSKVKKVRPFRRGTHVLPNQTRSSAPGALRASLVPACTSPHLIREILLFLTAGL